MAVEAFIIPTGNDTGEVAEDPSETLRDVVGRLREEDSLAIAMEDNYADAVSALRGWDQLELKDVVPLMEILLQNAAELAGSIPHVIEDASAVSSDAIILHQNAAKQYVHLLYLMHSKAATTYQQHASDAKKEAAKSGEAPKKGGRGKKAAASADASSDVTRWQLLKENAVHAVLQLLMADLPRLMSSKSSTSRVAELCVMMALREMECTESLQCPNFKTRLYHLLGLAASRYGCADMAAELLLAAVRRHEHLAEHAAQLAAYAEHKCGSNQLAVRLIQGFCKPSPQQYDEEYSRSSSSIKHLAAMIEQLAEALPKTVGACASQLSQYMACGAAYQIRSALVTAYGAILLGAHGSAAEASGRQEARSRSHERLLQELLQRFLDKSSFTRHRVIKTWSALVTSNSGTSCYKLELSLWLPVLQAAVARLQDSALLVQKSSLQLCVALLNCCPWAVTGARGLDVAKLQAALGDQQGKLEELLLQQQREEEEGAQFAAGALKVAAAEEEEQEEVDGMEVDDGSSEQQQEEQREEEAVGSAPLSAAQEQIVRLKATIATLQLGIEFARTLVAAMPQLRSMLASAQAAAEKSAADLVHWVVHLLSDAAAHGVAGAAGALRGSWPLIFSREEAVRASVVDAWRNTHLQKGAGLRAQAEALVGAVHGCSAGELDCLAAILAQLFVEEEREGVAAGQRRLACVVTQVLALAVEAYREHKQGAAQQQDTQDDLQQQQQQQQPQQQQEEEGGRPLATLRHSMCLLSMVAAHTDVLVAQLDVLLQVGFSPSLGDAWVSQHTCKALEAMAGHIKGRQLPADSVRNLHLQLCRALLSEHYAPDEWSAVAGSALSALCALHPHPHQLLLHVLDALAGQALGAAAAPGFGAGQEARPTGHVRLAKLERLFFVLGRTGMLLHRHIERLSKAIRDKRLWEERRAVEGRADKRAAGAGAAADKDDITAQIGGGITADAELDRLSDQLEQQVLAAGGLVGRYGWLLSELCHQQLLLALEPRARQCALLALAQLMAVDAAFCERNVALLFTLLQNRSLGAAVRCNLLVAIGDLESRWPNTMEPWTSHVYAPLADPDAGVRRTCLLVLTHLILNDMMKVRSHISKVALLLLDPEPAVALLARKFFATLAKKSAGGGSSPIYNLLPDMLSNLTAEALPPQDFRTVMAFLLELVDKKADELKAKLCGRFASEHDPAVWRSYAFCLSSLGHSERGLRGVMEAVRSYAHALGEGAVMEAMMSLGDKGLKAADKKGDMHARIEEWQQQLRHLHAQATGKEVQEEEAGPAAAAAAAADTVEVSDQVQGGAAAKGRGARGRPAAAAAAAAAAVRRKAAARAVAESSDDDGDGSSDGGSSDEIELSSSEEAEEAAPAGVHGGGRRGAAAAAKVAGAAAAGGGGRARRSRAAAGDGDGGGLSDVEEGLQGLGL